MTIPKFRAWHKELKIMEPVLVINWECTEIFTSSTWSADCGLLEIGWDFDDIELMQCIGEDKKGQDVYQGDILDNGITKFIVPMESPHSHTLSDCCGITIQGWNLKGALNGCIKIGNRFEHPELLEK